MVKQVMKNFYAHKSNIAELVECGRNPVWKLAIKNNIERCPYPYDVIKYDSIKETLSFIQSPDWDTAKEPVVGDSNIFSMITGEWKFKKGRTSNPQIYHSKELFVADDYKGFDIEQAQRRTQEWNAIPNLDKKRIGNQNFWFEVLDANGLER